MKLGIFGRDNDPLTAHTAELARARGFDVVTVAFSEMLHGAPAALAAGGAPATASWTWAGHALDACDAFVVRRFPSTHALLGPPEETASAAEWFTRGMKQVERSTFAQAALLDLEQRGKPIVNGLATSSLYEHKPLQLAAFARAGLPIPRSLVTNDPARVDAFAVACGGALVVKPAAGGAAALAVDDAVRARMESIREAPVIFQERVDGDDVRVTVVGDRVVSAVVVAGDEREPASEVDYRKRSWYRAGDAVYRAHALPDDVAALCVRAAALCGHVLSGIDLKRRADGAYVLLEANSAPDYLDIERKTGAAITDAVLDWLASRSGVG